MTNVVDHANSVNVVGKALVVYENNEVWIIDTGETNHMVSKIDMLSQDSIVKTQSPKPVYLPNSEECQMSLI